MAVDLSPYRPGVVSTGPFPDEPAALFRVVGYHPDGTDRHGADIVATTEAWLLAALTDAGLTLGDGDRQIVRAIAEDSWSVAHVVAGWALRARSEPGAATEQR